MRREKISQDRVKEIQAGVDQYINTIITDGRDLANSPQELFEFYRSDAYYRLEKRERRIAKEYFKSQLPYTEWRENVSKDRNRLLEEIEDYEKYLRERGM